MTSPPEPTDSPDTIKEIWVFLVEFPASVRDNAVDYVINSDSDDVTVKLAQRLPFPAPPESLRQSSYTLVD